MLILDIFLLNPLPSVSVRLRHSKGKRGMGKEVVFEIYLRLTGQRDNDFSESDGVEKVGFQLHESNKIGLYQLTNGDSGPDKDRKVRHGILTLSICIEVVSFCLDLDFNCI